MGLRHPSNQRIYGAIEYKSLIRMGHTYYIIIHLVQSLRKTLGDGIIVGRALGVGIPWVQTRPYGDLISEHLV